MYSPLSKLTSSITSKATEIADNVSDKARQGVESMSTAATNLADSINETAVRNSIAQMCTLLELAIEELKKRPLSERPISLTSIVNFGVASLEMQINLTPEELKS